MELLSGLANDTYSNALNAISTALGGSSNANSYNNNVYKAVSDLAGTNSTSGTNSLLASLLGLTGNGASSLFSGL